MAINLDGNGVNTTGLINSGTAVASTSGTSIDFTGIPAGVKRITAVLSNVSTTGSGNLTLQIGSGSIATSGYTSSNAVVVSGASTVVGTNASAFTLTNTLSASDSVSGSFVLNLVGSNTWVGSGVFINMNSRANIDAGTITLSGAIDRLRISTTDTFDAGSINILYE